MTNREFIERTTESLEEMNDLLLCVEMYSCFTAGETDVPESIERVLNVLPTRDAVEDAITAIRKNFEREYRYLLCRYFRMFERPSSSFTADATYVCDVDKIAVREDNGSYYIVKILNPESYFSGILQTECHDDFPYHMYPQSYTAYRYPETAMVWHIASKDPGWLDSDMIGQ